MTRFALDTNVILYALQAGDAKLPTAQSLLREGPIISVQSLNETANVLLRKLHWDWRSIREVLANLRTVAADIRVIDVDIHAHGIELAAKHKFSVYDAMIVAVAIRADCEILYSEDMHHGLVIDDRLTITNPFLGR